MSSFIDEDDRLPYETSCDETSESLGGARSFINTDGEPPTPTIMEAEKRIRREIANSNERRRMQSINNGFQSLRSLLPHHEGEKLSKAAILQQTAEYIYTLEQEKTRLLSQNCQLKRLINQHEGGELPPKKRKTEVIISESSDEGLGSMSPEPIKVLPVVAQSESVTELKQQLAHERNLRMMLEEQNRQLENQLYQQQIYHDEPEEISLQLVEAESLPPVGHTQTVVCSPPVSRSPSPVPVVVQPEQRLPSVLEAAIKAEPKVEVERLPSPTPHDDANQARLYVSNTSRQNLETIVEAIRHLEGDHMFGDGPLAQEVPLALTTRSAAPAAPPTPPTPPTETPAGGEQQHIKLEVTNAFIDFHHGSSSSSSVVVASTVQQQQQSRPGVIVGKQTAVVAVASAAASS